MNRNVIIGIALVGVVGAGLYLARQQSTSLAKPEDGVRAFEKARSASSIVDDFAPDSSDTPSMVDTGSSAGSAAAIVPDAPAIRGSNVTRELRADLR